MIDGLWTAIFSSVSMSGAGVIYLTNGQAVGGDNQYYYTGTYTFDETTHRLKARLKVDAFVPGAISIFGVPASTFTIDLSGQIVGENASVSGSVLQWPSANIRIQLVRRAKKISG